MNSESRNLFVVGIVITSMTVGAFILNKLEPQPLRYASAPLSANAGTPIESVTVVYVPDLKRETPAHFDAIVPITGKEIWSPRGDANVRIAVESSGKNALPAAHKEKLLRLLAGIAATRGNSTLQVSYETPESDTLVDSVRSESDTLRSWLELKGVLN